MKKFLSLVLALVMTMSLVTISAGATEYKDFTDKDEIKYAEAVTVLNKLGIITGYSEGDFRPEGELTRGAAAKIIVSLLIGPEAAEALGNESSPYPDVPAGNTFAGVISFCKTSEIINGYGDGTFRPQGTLTGYAFAKMLLGALGYDGKLEGFSGPGWNMKVAKLGGEAGLFDRISFNGNATVTREQACQLALNTIKGTMVEYSGGMNITNGDTTMVVNATRNYKTSNQEYATHINNKKASDRAEDDFYTVEFGEEHFIDLRMSKQETKAADVFGRPSNEWSWKKVTIGTFPIEPDYVFTAQTSHLDATDAAKNRATGLGSLKLDDGANKATYTDFWLNGKKIALSSGSWETGNDFGFSGKAEVADISDLTDNGVTVEVYVSDQVANFITDVVVVKTQLMEVRRVGSDYVALQAYDNGKPENNENDGRVEGFNQVAINEPVTNVQSEDDAYAVLSGLKAGDIVAVVPVSSDEAGSEYEVAYAYVPEQVKGSLTAAETYSTKLGTEKKTISVTVGGTKYNVAQWSKDLVGIDSNSVKVTKKDVTLFLDAQGNAMLAKDVGSTEDFIIIGNFSRTMVDNRIVTIANGWDISGEPLELNLGTKTNVEAGWAPGDLAYYTNASANHADWALSREGGKAAWNDGKGGEKIAKEYVVGEVVADDVYEIKSSNVQVKVDTYGSTPSTYNNFLYTDKSVKFVYVNYNSEGEVDSVEVKTGVQNVKAPEIKEDGESNYGAQVAVKKDTVKAVVIKAESNDAVASNLMYIRERSGGYEKDENGNMIYKYTVVMMRPNERVDDEVVIYSDDDVRADTFVAYTAKEHANYSNFYDLRDHSSLVNRTTGTYQAQLASIVAENGSLLYLGNYAKVKGDTKGLQGNGSNQPEVEINTAPGAINTNGGVNNIVRITNAEIVDLRWDAKTAKPGDREIRSIDDLKWYFKEAEANIKLDVDGNGWLDVATDRTLEMQLVVNDNPSSDYFRDVALIVITDIVRGNSGLAEPEGPPSTAADLSVVAKKGETEIAEAVFDAEHKATITLTDANKDAVLSFTMSEGAKATISSSTITGLSNAADLVAIPDTTDSQADGSATIKVVPASGDADAITYTLTIKIDDGSYKNETALGYSTKVTKGNGYAASDWTVAAENVGTKITLTKGAFSFPFLNTGDETETMAQLKEAVTFWNDKMNGSPKLGTPELRLNGSYEIPTADGTDKATFDPATVGAKVYIVDGSDGKIVANTTKVSSLTTGNNTTGLTTGVTVGETMAPVGGLGASVIPGGTYEKDKYAEVGAELTAVTTGDNWAVEYVYEEGAVAESNGKDWVEIGSEVKVVFTAKAEMDLGTATAPKLAITTIEADATAVYNNAGGGTATLKETSCTKKDTVFTESAGKIAKDDTVTYTYTIDTRTGVLSNGVFQLTSATWTTT